MLYGPHSTIEMSLTNTFVSLFNSVLIELHGIHSSVVGQYNSAFPVEIHFFPEIAERSTALFFVEILFPLVEL